jgi:hypothetical protein
MPQHVFGTASQAALQANGELTPLGLTNLIAIVVLQVPFVQVDQLYLLAAHLVKDQILEQLLVLYRQRAMQAIIYRTDAAHSAFLVIHALEVLLHHHSVLPALFQSTQMVKQQLSCRANLTLMVV